MQETNNIIVQENRTFYFVASVMTSKVAFWSKGSGSSLGYTSKISGPINVYLTSLIHST